MFQTALYSVFFWVDYFIFMRKPAWNVFSQNIYVFLTPPLIVFLPLYRLPLVSMTPNILVFFLKLSFFSEKYSFQIFPTEDH